MSKENTVINPRTELKQRVIQVALNEFRVQGVKAVRMDDLASQIGISKRTLYEMFKDKEELLMDCLLYSNQREKERVNDIRSKSKNVLEVILGVFLYSIEMLHETNKLFFEDIKKYPAAYKLVQEVRNSDSKEKMAFFRQGVEQGIFRSDINYPIVDELVKQQFNLLVNTDFFSHHPFLDVYESIMFTYLRGISTVEGARMLEMFIKEYRGNKN